MSAIMDTVTTGNLDLLSLVKSDVTLKKTSSHRGGEWHGPCPVCGGSDRLRVQPARNFWRCRQCGRSGDAIAYMVETGRYTKRDAYKARHGDEVTPGTGNAAKPRPPAPPEPCAPPSERWQGRAWDFIAYSQAQLWGDGGGDALRWLRNRGLAIETIEAAGLGYNPGDVRDKPRRWGLAEDHKPIWLPKGIVIPWIVGPDVWRVNIRRPTGTPKYIGPAGCGNALYNADRITSARPAMLFEGELDALLIEQLAGDLVTPCATGSARGARRLRWIIALSQAPFALLTFDRDAAGKDARAYWGKALDNTRAWLPYWGDAGDMAASGADLRAWVKSGITS